MDGFALCRQLRALWRRHVPITLLLHRHDGAARARALEAGADDYLLRPFDVCEALTRLRVGLELGRRFEEAEALELAVGRLCHDASQPLSELLGYAELIDAGIAGEQLPSYAHRIVRATERLASMLEELSRLRRLRLIPPNLAAVPPRERAIGDLQAG